jgi:mannan endo-1,4-beta-mannosidase
MLTKKTLLALCLFAALILPAIAAAAPAVIVNGYQDEGGRRFPEDDVKTIVAAGAGHNIYTDHASGFSLRYPAHMTADWSLSALRTVFTDDTTRIEVYHDDFRGTAATAADYIHYGNKFVKASPHHTILADQWLQAGGRQAHLLAWTRPSLARVPGDKNHYASLEIVKNDYEVYTIFIKSAAPITGAADILAGFALVDRQGVPRNYKRFAPSRTPMNAETAAFYSRYFGDRAPLAWGIFEPSAPQTLGPLATIEKRLDFAFPVLLHYQMFDEQFPVWGLDNAYRSGKFVELTLQTTFSGQVNALWATENRNAGMVYAILDGQYDDYFAAYADNLKAFGHPVLFRLNNEMNGDWCWYSAFYTGKDADLYQALWRYIHDLFVARGVDNVVWVWNPHDVSLPAFKWNSYLAYYPGDAYVDVVGLTGYNNGTYFPGERWREFSEIYPALHDEYANHFDKPFMITEFSSNSVGGDKVAWIHGMFDGIKKLDRLKIAVWWSGVDFDQQGNPGRIYLINESEEILDAFKSRLQEYKGVR